MNRRCQATITALAELASEAAEVPNGVSAHVEECFRCRGELARHRKLLRRLRQLRECGLEPPPRLLDQLLENLSESPETASAVSGWWRRRVNYLLVAVAATGAAGTGAVLLVLRGRAGTRLAG